jgi:hypothetical protein
MSTQISVDKISDAEFRVTISEGSTKSSHRVTLKQTDYQRLTAGKVGQRDLIARSFEFLLEHEPKESILTEFDLLEISRYFPSFERELQHRLKTP